MSKKKIILIISILFIISFLTVKAVDNLSIINITGGDTYSGSTKSIYATTYVSADCTLAYSTNSDTSNGTTILGNIVQTPTETNDGKYHFWFQLSNLDGSSTYYYKIMCSSDSQTDVSDIKNISIEKPDLTIDDITIQNEKIRVIYSNIGKANAQEGFKVTCNGDLNLQETVNKGAAMNPNEERYAEFSAEPGTYQLSCEVDSENIINESNENNNSYQKTITIGTVVLDDINIYNVKATGLTKNTANIYWSANSSYDCDVKYGLNHNLNSSAQGGLVQSGNSSNNGEYIYYKKLENLSPSTTYYYKITCTDNSNNSNSSNENNFTTLEDYADITLSNINVQHLAGDAVKIIWNTSEETSHNGVMYNSPTTGMGKLAKTEYTTNHEVIITDLSQNTKYTYRVYSYIYDGTSVGAVSDYLDFTTSGSTQYDKNLLPVEPTLTEPQKETIVIEGKAKLLNNNMIDDILKELHELRDLVKEQQTQINYLTKLTQDLSDITENMQNAINYFITYGVDENTKKLGAGERAAVMYSYKEAYDKLPENDDDLANAIKIANGRWPSVTSTEAENNAKIQFKKIYKRDANMDNPNDNAAITVMAYGLRQKAENRNLESEKAGINIFKGIYGHVPSNTEEWNIMQAITYSGAKR